MLLAIDVGNTQTHLGAFRGDELAEHWRFQTRAGATGDELAERIAGLLGLSGIEIAVIEAIVVSSVVPPLGAEYEAMARRYYDASCLTVGPKIKTGTVDGESRRAFIRNNDVASTVMRLFGLDAPRKNVGKPIKAAFERGALR